MEKGEQSFADVWGFDSTEYGADADNHVEEVVTEVLEGAEVEDAKSKADEVSEDTKKDESGKPDSVAEGGEAAVVEEVVEKQDEKEEVVKEDAPTETTAEDLTIYDEVAQELVNEGLIDFDDDKEYDLDTSQGLKDLLTENLEKNSVKAVDAYKEGLGDDAKKLLEVLDKGGSFDDYTSMEQQENFADVPLESKSGSQYEQNQAYLIQDWLKIQGFTEEEADEQVKEFHSAGLLRKQAELSQKKLTAWQAEKNETLLAQRETEKVESEKLAEEQAIQFQEEVTGTREIAGFKVTEAKAKKLYDFITKKDKDGQSEFTKVDTPENKLLYAYFAMEGFDKEKLSKEVASKQARKLRRKLSRPTDPNATPKRGAQQVRKTDQETPDIPWLL